MCRILLKK